MKHTEPAFIEPMQCKSVTALSADDKWTFEIKFDGYRCIVVKRGREVTLFSRHKKVFNRRFSSVVQALASLKGDFVLDGELVALRIRKGDLHSSSCKTAFRSTLPTLFLRLRFTEPKWQAVGEFAFFPSARGA